jgi:hypothetical protein
MMQLRPDHLKAVGGAAPCQASPPPPADPPPSAGASVLVVDESKTGWIGLALKDSLKAPVAGAEFEVTLPDGHKVGGRLDATGRVRIEGIDPGQFYVLLIQFLL